MAYSGSVGQWSTAVALLGTVGSLAWSAYQFILARRRAQAEEKLHIEREENRLTTIESGLEFHEKTLDDHASRIGRLEAK